MGRWWVVDLRCIISCIIVLDGIVLNRIVVLERRVERARRWCIRRRTR